MVDPTPVENISVLDWDCLIVNEKKSNYQLMANAVFIAAENHASTHPVLGRIADALTPYLDGKNYQEGMPLLCMGKEAFASHGIANPSVWKSHIPEDLMAKLPSIAPDIEVTLQERGQLVNILRTEFRRQYKALTRPAVPAEVVARETALRASSNVDLPFKNVALEFMPGAEAFLEKQRTPDARLILISNKGDNDLHNEVNKLGIAHFFDIISGVKKDTVGENIIDKDKKPSSHRLQQALTDLSLDHRDIPIHLWGDQRQDVTQAAQLAVTGKHELITGTVVNPATDATGQPALIDGVPVTYRKSLL